MEPTIRQFTFLADLRRGPRRAAAYLDASMVGPLIRANLVQWDDEPGDAARRRRPPSTIFALTGLGACLLAEHEARCCEIASPV
jgi:hypothetical protein